MPAAKKAPPKPQSAAQPASKPLKKDDHLFIVDGSGYIFRAYHALPPINRKSDGLQLNAVFGFCNMLWKLLRDMKDDKPTHLAVVFDLSEHTFRTDMYPDYKAHRPDPPDDLRPQFPLIREAVHAFDLPCLEQRGFEADDLIATYVRQASEAGATSTIVSSDKDLMQLVTDRVIMYDTMKDKRIGRAEVIEKFGVPPDKVIEVQALIGDSTDNVPGVPGVGPKAAAVLISELGSLDEIFNSKPETLDERLTERLSQLQSEIDKIAGGPIKISSAVEVAKVLQSKFGIKDLPPDKKGIPSADSAKIEELATGGNHFCELIVQARSVSRAIGGTVRKVFDGEQKALLSKKLVTLDANVKLDVPIGDLAVHEPDYKRLVAFLKAMEFSSLIRRVAEFSSIEVNEIEPEAKLSANGAASARIADADEVSQVAPAAAPFRNAGGNTAAYPPLTPKALVAARAEAARGAKFDRSKYQTVRNADELKAWAERAWDVGVVAIDTIAASDDPMQAELCGLSLAVAPNEACYVPLSHRQGGEGAGLFRGDMAPGQISERAALDVLKPILEDRGVIKIGHDLKFTWQLFALRGIEIAAYDDTLLMSYALDAGSYSHGLDALAGRVFNHAALDVGTLTKAGKAKITFDAVGIDRATEYAAERADIVLRLWRVLKPRLAAEQLRNVYETLERPLLAVLGHMERRGIAIDRQVLSRLSGEFAQEAAGLQDEINTLAAEPVNVGSPKQIGDILFGKLGLAGGTKTKTGQWATGARLLEELAEQGHELPQKILDWRQVSKLKSTYTDALPGFVNPTTKRVHTNYALAATTTGRLSSSEPNLQNIPVRTEDGRKIRRAFIADPGQKLVSADYSQIELRLLAEIAGIEQLRKAFRDGLDIHAMTASEMFGVPVKNMPAEVRRRAKAINFGIVYGISAFGLANQLGIEREEAGAYIRKYFERFPGIRDYIEETKTYARNNGYVLTLFGRKCHYPEIKASNASVRAFNERAAVNARLQGTAADIIRRAMVRMDTALAKKKLSAQMLLQVHDELVFEVPDDEVEKTLPVVTNVMVEAPLPALSLSVPLQVEAHAAGNWDDAH
jgi:DNA polymerase-1